MKKVRSDLFNLEDAPEWARWVELVMQPGTPGRYQVIEIIWWGHTKEQYAVDRNFDVALEDLPVWAQERLAVLLVAPVNFWDTRIGARTHTTLRPMLQLGGPDLAHHHPPRLWGSL